MSTARSAVWGKAVTHYETTNSMEIHKLELRQNLPKITKGKQQVHYRKEVPTRRENRLRLPQITPRTSNPRTNDPLAEAQLQLPSTTCNVVTPAASIENEPLLKNDIENTPSTVRLPLRIGNHLRLVLLHTNADRIQNDYKDSIGRFHSIFGQIEIFTQPDECIDFVQRNSHQSIFLIVSHGFAQSVIPIIHDLPQLDSVYIQCIRIPKQKQWINQWEKVEDMYINLDAIYEAVRVALQVNRRESLVISDTSLDLNGLDSTFMYTKLLKEILLSMTYDGQPSKEFVDFCRQKYYDPKSKTYLEVIDELAENYHKHSSVWWYTRDCFLHRLVNEAFRGQDMAVIIQIAFFIQDLGRQIEQLHIQPTKRRTFYRGQGLSHVDFNQLQMMKGGLLCFNSFLSTSTKKVVAKMYAESAAQNRDLQGIIFEITVDPAALTSTRFASMSREGYYKDEEGEVIFTTHSIFRIGTITRREDQLVQVNLTLTSDDDNDLKNVTEYIRKQTQGVTGWDRLGKLLLGIGMFDKAEEVYQMLMTNSSENHGQRCHMLGIVKKCKGEVNEALDLFSMALEVYADSPDPNHICLAAIYNDIGSVYHHNQEFDKALHNHQMALEEQKRRTPHNRADLVVTYGHLADVHKSMEQYSEALSLYAKQLKLLKKSHPVKHSDLVVTYEKIAEVHEYMQTYSRALVYSKKALHIRQGYPIQDYLDIAARLNNISEIHEKTGTYLEAIVHSEQARDLLRKLVPMDYSELAKVCERIGELYERIENFPQAFSCYKETRRYLQRSSDWEVTNLARIHDNIGRMYEKLGDDEQAYYSYRKAVEGERNAWWPNECRLQLYRKHFLDVQRKLCLHVESSFQ